MGDGYEHRFLACTPAQHDNLRALARYLVANGEAIDAGSGVLFDPAYMIGLAPTPFDLADAAPAPQLIPLPRLLTVPSAASSRCATKAGTITASDLSG